MKLSIIIPRYNEQFTIREIIQKIKLKTEFNKEIIIIDDFSTDKTRDILMKELNGSIDKVVLNEKNYGKGYSIRKGLEVASGDCILIQDAYFGVFCHKQN